jgi:hypothetical protein
MLCRKVSDKPENLLRRDCSNDKLRIKCTKGLEKSSTIYRSIDLRANGIFKKLDRLKCHINNFQIHPLNIHSRQNPIATIE